MLVLEAADAQHEVDGPRAVDDKGCLGEHILEACLGDAEVFSA